MQIHKIVKDTISQHKNKIELAQWAIISGVASLVYTEYLVNIKWKTIPTTVILVPKISAVQELLNPDNSFMDLLSNKLIDGIANNETFKLYKDAPELILFNDDNIEVMKTLFDLYITPNIYKRLPETIAKKFSLDINESTKKQGTIIQSNELDLFNRQPIDDKELDFIIEETVLQLLTLLPTMKKDIVLPESNQSIMVSKDSILTIGNEKAICPIHFSDKVFNNDKVINKLLFVTDTSIIKDSTTYRDIKTGLFNQVSVTSFEGI